MGIALAGRRVLFAAPRFFGYDNDIVAELERRGATVVRIYDRPFATPFMTAVTKVAPGVIARAALSEYRAVLAAEEAFDLILVINGQTLSSGFLDEVRRHSPQAARILYIWDSLDNRGSIIPNLPRYDRVLGFDRIDTQRHGFEYRPLFFVPAFDRADKTGRTEPDYDLSFIGTAHSDRAPIVHALDATLGPDVRRFWYLFLQAPWVRQYYALKSRSFARVPASRFHYQSISKSDIGAVFHRSRAILDIEHPQQRGLTMRTFETIGASKKLVTTNAHVVHEDFYHPDRVLLIDRARPRIDPEFLRSPTPPLDPALRARYSLAGWLDEITAGVAL